MENEGRIEIAGRFPVSLAEVIQFIDSALHDAKLCGCEHEGDWYVISGVRGFEDDNLDPER
jgi:hypothetical protein